MNRNNCPIFILQSSFLCLWAERYNHLKIMFMKQKHWIILGLVVIAITAVSCVPGGGSYNPLKPAGFFSGIWHGWIAPFSLILGIFNSSISLYETYNTGWWYDFGFYMAVISGFGGLQLARKKRRN